MRARALHDWGVLTYPPEGLENIFVLVCRATRASAGAVAFIDDATVHVRASYNIDPSPFPIEDSIAARSLDGPGVLLIRDTLEVRELRQNRFVRGPPHARSLAACRVAPALNIPVGTLVLVHHEPEHFTADDIDLIERAAALIERELQRHLYASDALARMTLPKGALAEPPALEAALQLPHPLARLLLKKWSPQILRVLRDEPGIRFTDLLHRLPGVSSRTLSDRLKEMQEQRLIAREQLATMPVRVSYRLTEEGAAAADVATLVERPDAVGAT